MAWVLSGLDGRVAAALFLGILLLHGALLVGVVGALQEQGTTLEEYLNGFDAGEYLALGEGLVHGKFVSPLTNTPEVFRTPGYPAIVALLLFLSAGSAGFVVFFNTLFVAFASVGVYLLGRKFLPPIPSAICALVAGASFDVLALSASGMGSDLVYFLLLVLASGLVVLPVPATEKRLFLRAVALGLLFGVAILVRPVGLYLIPLFAFALAVREPLLPLLRRIVIAGCVLIVCGAVVLPWYVRNMLQSGMFMLSTLPAYNVTFYNIPQFLANAHGTTEAFERAALLEDLGNPTAEELRSVKLQEKLRIIDARFFAEYFVPYGIFHAVKTIPFFVSSGLSQFSEVAVRAGLPFPTIGHGSNLTSLLLAGDVAAVLRVLAESLPVLIEALAWALVFTLAAGALGYVGFYGRSNRDLLVFLLLGGAVVLISALLSGVVAQPRYRAPVSFYVLIAAAWALQSLITSLRGRSFRYLRSK